MKKIVQDGSKVLREIAKPIPEDLFGSAKLSHLIKDMTEALDKEQEGVALAAPQVGASYRLFIVRKDRTLPPPSLQPSPKDMADTAKATGSTAPGKTKPDVQIYINPAIIKTSRKRAEEDEGCLSIRGVYGTTKRHERVTISARGIDGKKFTRGAGGLMAQIFEHEIDHLNGILFTDHAIRFIRP